MIIRFSDENLPKMGLLDQFYARIMAITWEYTDTKSEVYVKSYENALNVFFEFTDWSLL